MILLGIVYGAVTGNMQAVTDAVFASAKEAVTLCITMTGMMALWVGVMEIARGAGLIRKWSEKLKPFIHFLFPGIPKGHKVQEYLAANMIANILGLGSAATPVGLKAREELAKIKKEKGLPEEVASNEMCTFLIVNISSLQLIPVSVIAYRSQYGSTHPLAVAGPAFLATCISTLAGVAVCRVMCRRKQYKSIKKDGWK